jgi:hypothetical protein
MRVRVKSLIVEGTLTLEKGLEGYVVAACWGDKGSRYVVDFEKHGRIIINTENLIVLDERKIIDEKPSEKKEGKNWKQERKAGL